MTKTEKVTDALPTSTPTPPLNSVPGQNTSIRHRHEVNHSVNTSKETIEVDFYRLT